MKDREPATETIALMMSGGLDSAILLGHLLKQGFQVQPIYITTGCVWQAAEQRAIQSFIRKLPSNSVDPLVELDMPLADLYGEHWSMTGKGVPSQETLDEAVFLWGRNPLLLVKAMLWCATQGISQLNMATLESNPFADATPTFFQQFEQSLKTATGASVKVVVPFANLSKQQVLELGADLPLHLTFSCLAPIDGMHCGICNKCAERTLGLQALPAGDPTSYAEQPALVDQLS
ncbi:MAG: 7-cyano-7-deazaguanine synthase [Planctomycetales bacterium]|nr:7-cyano-7-deazaguanine synthase [Planctomycetales bacterium]